MNNSNIFPFLNSDIDSLICWEQALAVVTRPRQLLGLVTFEIRIRTAVRSQDIRFRDRY
jgi:hypothetical protein